MFLVRRMFSQAVTQEFLVSELGRILKRYSNKPFELGFTYKEAGLDQMDMMEVVALLELYSNVWVDSDKVGSLETFQSVIDLILETSARNLQGSKEKNAEEFENKTSS